jgi:thiol-disulfide isomerase/thioredoxin
VPDIAVADTALSAADMKIDKFANLAVIVMASVFIGPTVYDRLSPRPASKPFSPERVTAKNLVFPLAVRTGSRATVVLFVSPNCHFCTESMPFYARLTGLRPRGSDSFRIPGVTPANGGDGEDVRRYFKDHKVNVDAMVQMQYSEIGVSGTPTLALLDSSGRVVRAWTGKLPRAIEEEVIKSIRALCPECEET